MLRPLSALRYEVREGMAAAWIEQARIVVHKRTSRSMASNLARPPLEEPDNSASEIYSQTLVFVQNF